MNNLVSIVVGLALVLGVGGVVYWQTLSHDVPLQPDTETDVTPDTGAAPRGDVEDDEEEIEFEDGTVPGASTGGGSAGGSGVSQGGITAATVAQHNSRASCWSSVNGNVYNLTSWIPKHPGGEQAILQLCGTDGSAKFNGQHGGDSGKAAVLAGFKVGVLAK